MYESGKGLRNNSAKYKALNYNYFKHIIYFIL